jgi:hypothetical protein
MATHLLGNRLAYTHDNGLLATKAHQAIYTAALHLKSTAQRANIMLQSGMLQHCQSSLLPCRYSSVNYLYMCHNVNRDNHNSRHTNTAWMRHSVLIRNCGQRNTSIWCITIHQVKLDELTVSYCQCCKCWAIIVNTNINDPVTSISTSMLHCKRGNKQAAAAVMACRSTQV